MIISANEVKTRGVSVFAQMLEKFDELTINVRGKNKYVVMDIERYKDLRALELDSLYEKAMTDIKDGNYKVMSAEEHLKELMYELQNSSN
ncbi:MAG: prevent-host-death protein [Sulfurovaceae bacterium]|nr:prevent-host-death protein [Sulfurovaceae bacterium]MDD5549536.1 prevent-host-death protein [Sulfurovaceae bacterium]